MRRLALVLMLPLSCAGATLDDLVSAAVEAQLSEANVYTGEELYRLRPREPIFFLGYVSGLIDTGSMTGPKLRRYCMPKGATPGQAGDVAYKYLDANPALRHLGAAHLVRQSLHEAWPCPVVPAQTPAKRSNL